MDAPEAAETDEAMAWMGMPTPVDQMPGMATEAQLEELAASSGAAADELFVELMAAHHAAASHMAECGRRGRCQRARCASIGGCPWPASQADGDRRAANGSID